MTKAILPDSKAHSGLPAAHDNALVARIAEREEGAFRTVIEAHAPSLHRIAYRMMGDAHEAEDIAQEAMLRLWNNAPRLAEKLAGENTPGIKLLPWLKRVTINLAIDRLRVAKRVSGEEVPERADAAPLADARLEADEEAGTARALISQLSDRQRAAIVLTYYEDMPNAEAAGVMDMNIKAFESLLHRARSALRKAFEAHQVQEGGRT